MFYMILIITNEEFELDNMLNNLENIQIDVKNGLIFYNRFNQKLKLKLKMNK